MLVVALRPLLPMLALPMLWYGEVISEFTAHLIALIYMSVLLVLSSPWLVIRTVLQITTPQLVLAYLIAGDAVSPQIGHIIGLVWLIILAFTNFRTRSTG